MASAAIVEHTFLVQNKTVTRLCHEQVIVTVNGLYPGPKLEVTEGDSVIVHVINNSPYNVTIHWHGVFQLFSAWADGPEYITQCSIRPAHNFTYKFNVTQQEGTVWWHAHASVVRATVHGALIIRPRSGRFPFPKPYKEVPIILDIYKLRVRHGKTYLFRMVNAALANNLFFKITNHKFTVVALDAAYTEPYVTDILVIAAGQSADVLFTADQPKSSYYMAASPYVVGEPVPLFDNTTTRGILYYEGYKKSKTNHTLVMPALPLHNNTPIAHKFFSSINGLVGAPHWVPVPLEVDEHMFITINMGLQHCPLNATCTGPLRQKFSASMNNESFALPVGKGVWFLHCHVDDHNLWGLVTAFIVENGPTPSTSLGPPPADLPKC
ncbi:hypothetical protein TSUD_163170 [Trifolium subterraneum]|uniref:Laccase n=1 Tax=Trifolium subterraneum TaxID=3900 RepID=A0A2Z6PAV4_TRISU|nr:hypothetical protein TSUD_163170 [Trifolium subterraneum]